MTLDVTVAVIAADEPEDRLARMLGAVAEQDGVGSFEVVVAVPPGQEADALRAAAQVGIEVVVVPNPGGGRTAGLNRILARAEGHLFARVDVRSLIPADYLARCAARLAAMPEVGVVGGAQLAEARGDHRVHGDQADVVARALRNPLALGGPAYRRQSGGGPVDTVYLGAFRTDELRALGGFDERLVANEDFDVAERYRRAGRLVWLEAGLAVRYEPRSDGRAALEQYWRFGQAKATYWLLGKGRPNARQAVALGGSAVAVGLTAVRPRWGIALGLAGLAAAGAADLATGRDDDPARVRAAGAALSVGLAGAWVAGVATGLVRSGWRRAGRPAGGA